MQYRRRLPKPEQCLQKWKESECIRGVDRPLASRMQGKLLEWQQMRCGQESREQTGEANPHNRRKRSPVAVAPPTRDKQPERESTGH